MEERHLWPLAASFAWTFVSLYAVEKAADYYYFASSPIFFTISGLRLEAFIIIALAGSAASGRLVGRVSLALAPQMAAVAVALAAFYSLCDPRVCFSAGPDGLEPLRLGAFLAAVCICGAWLGEGTRGQRSPLTRPWSAVVWFSSFVALAYYPVIFTFAGAAMLTPIHPWGVAGVLFSAALASGVGGHLSTRSDTAFLVPALGFAATVLLSWGIAAAYVAQLLPVLALMATATLLGCAAGAFVSSRGTRPAASLSRATTVLIVLALSLDLVMTLVVLPDAVSGVAPATGAKATSSFAMAVPVYIGGYMLAPPGHASGAGVTVSLSSVSTSAIQVDNYLAAGLGIHSAGCCVDGIDYAFRFDLYLFHDGTGVLSATAWEVCDDNAACGGHSWKVLMFEHHGALGASPFASPVTLLTEWSTNASGSFVFWSYALGGSGPVTFTAFKTPPVENPNFNTGVVSGGTPGIEQQGSYFLQFGIQSRYPIGHSGWSVTLGCPKVLTTDWSCIQHAETLQGADSYWKVIWRWGESYPGVEVRPGPQNTVSFSGSETSTAPSFQTIW